MSYDGGGGIYKGPCSPPPLTTTTQLHLHYNSNSYLTRHCRLNYYLNCNKLFSINKKSPHNGAQGPLRPHLSRQVCQWLSHWLLASTSSQSPHLNPPTSNTPPLSLSSSTPMPSSPHTPPSPSPPQKAAPLRSTRTPSPKPRTTPSRRSTSRRNHPSGRIPSRYRPSRGTLTSTTRSSS